MKCYEVKCKTPCLYRNKALDVKLGELIIWCRNLDIFKAWKEAESVRLSTQNESTVKSQDELNAEAFEEAKRTHRYLLQERDRSVSSAAFWRHLQKLME